MKFMSVANDSSRQRYRKIRTVTLVGSAVDLVLGVGKLFFGFAAQSQALIADGVHSLSDLVTDAIVLFAAREALREADAEHPYGHARIETVATVALGASLVLIGAGIGIDAVGRLFEPELLLRPTAGALVVAALSVVLKEGVYHYTLRAARRLRSELLRANAWHSRTDAVSSLFVIVGVGGALAGLPYVDAVAAVAVAAMIALIGLRLVWSNVAELLDAGLGAARLEVIRTAIMQVDGVRALHMLRTRKMAGNALVDVHILLTDPRISVSEGHQISETVRARLLNEIEEVSDVMVHIDPEDDEDAEHAAPNTTLPLRHEALAQLNALWSDGAPVGDIVDIRLHYLDGRVHPEVVVSVGPTGSERSDIVEALCAPIRNSEQFAVPNVLFLSTAPNSTAPK
ncbi:MAG: cation diffusion facilitator family transporter [Gammaproteobacteria bacterium]|jgi:cation diffusion facilitator family transporter